MDGEQIGRLLTEASAAWSLDAPALDERAELDPGTARAVLEGRGDVGEIAAVAKALGGTLDDLLAARRFWEAPAAAFKNAANLKEPDAIRASLLRVAAAARDAIGLSSQLGAGAAEVERGFEPVALAPRVPKQAEELARQVRERIGNAEEPIASIRALMRRFGVRSFLFESDLEVDGCMWRDDSGSACAAANASARGGKLAALRMTFAHELCHALFDGTRLRSLGVLDVPTSHADALEQRASAFAAHLLAPRAGVLRFLKSRGLVAGNLPSPGLLRELSEHFEVGVEAMAHHLVSCELWSLADAKRYLWLKTHLANGEDNVETNPNAGEEIVPIERRGEVLRLATTALERGLISVGRWREVLELDASSDWRRLLDEQAEYDSEARSM